MSNNDPSNFSFRLQKGITNTSNPSRIIELNYVPSDSSSLDSNSSAPSYQFKSNDLTSTSSSSSSSDPKTLDVDSVSKFDLSKLLEKLKDLPIEDPVGSEDIYGLDTQVYYFSPSFEWVNGGPGGCIASEDSTSKVHPTKEQKETFKQIAEKNRGNVEKSLKFRIQNGESRSMMCLEIPKVCMKEIKSREQNEKDETREHVSILGLERGERADRDSTFLNKRTIN